MKKLVCTAVTIGVLATGAVSAVWANGTEMLTEAPAAASGYTLTIGTEKIDADTFTSGKCIMLPLRATAEKLGFKVVWNEENQSIDLDDGEVKTKVYIGKDNYYMASSTAIGMSAPTALGSAPVLKGDKTYVPAGMFEILCGKGSVAVKDSSVVINKDADNGTQIPNPWTEYKSVDEAKKAVNFEAPVPTKVTDGYKLDYISTLDGELLQIVYRNAEDKQISYRTAKGSGDISGDYNVYDTSEKLQVGGNTVTVKGIGGKYYLAIWEDGESAYSLGMSAGADKAEMLKIIGSVAAVE
mgnify:CR=1 FL=1